MPSPIHRIAYLLLTLILWTRGLELVLWDMYFALTDELDRIEGHETGDVDTTR